MIHLSPPATRWSCSSCKTSAAVLDVFKDAIVTQDEEEEGYQLGCDNWCVGISCSRVFFYDVIFNRDWMDFTEACFIPK